MVIKVIITTLDNLPILKQQVSILRQEPIDEIIVVNNGSIDGTREWLDEQDKLTVVHRDNNGAGPGRNAGLDAAEEFDYVLMIDGGIRPLFDGVKHMLDYLGNRLEVDVISPEIATCFTTNEEKAHRRMMAIDENTCFPQRALSSTAYALCRKRAWDGIRFSEEGPFGERGWGCDDNEMQMRWNHHGIIHHDFSGPLLYRRQSGSFQRLFKETGIWPNQYGSTFESRCVLMCQEWPRYVDLIWLQTNLQISVVLLGWNEYPMFAQAIKRIHDDLKDIPHEVIFVNNGSEDKTKWWLDTFALRWPHGDTVIDAETGEILRRREHPELEDVWTGNVRRIDFPENVGAGRGYTAGLDAVKTRKYVFLSDGDIVPELGSVIGLKNWLDEHEDVDYVAVNPWFQEGYGEFNGYDNAKYYGMGNYGYNFSMFRKEILDAGIRYPTTGPFAEAGCGYDDVDWVNEMYAAGFRCYVINTPAYQHLRRDLTRTGHQDPDAAIRRRKTWLGIKWPGQEYGIVYEWKQPAERKKRRVAVLGYGCGQVSDISQELTSNLNDICYAECFHLPNHIQLRGREDEVVPVPGEWDNYIIVDGGNWDRWEVPDWCHPSIYWAVDMFYPNGKHSWPQAEPIIQLERAGKADKVFCCHQNAVDFYLSNDILAKRLAPCADPKSEYPVEVERSFDWTALWHHCGERIPYIEALAKVYPNGYCIFKFLAEWNKWVNRGKCSINLSRLGELNWRPFEIMATRVPLITNRVPELDEFFIENEHYRGFSSPEELIEQVGWILANLDEAQEMADRAYGLVISDHTFYNRIMEMLR